MAVIESTKEGRPLYRVRWNYHRIDGKLTYDEKRFRNRDEALEFHRGATAAHTTDTETITVDRLSNLWLAMHVDTDACQLRTRKDYRTQLQLRILPYLGTRQVSKLTPKIVGEFREWMVERPTGATTVNKSLDTLKNMIRWGRAEGLCTNQLIDGVRGVKRPRPKPANPYPPDDVKRIVEGCQWLREATLISVAAYSGLRWSELRALKWTDIDFGTGTIDLTRSLDLDHTPKSTKSDRHRIVPILAPGLVALREWRKQTLHTGYDLVFPTRNGLPLREHGWYGKRLPKIRAACGIHFDLHELRDTYASILIATTEISAAELTLWLGTPVDSDDTRQLRQTLSETEGGPRSTRQPYACWPVVIGTCASFNHDHDGRFRVGVVDSPCFVRSVRISWKYHAPREFWKASSSRIFVVPGSILTLIAEPPESSVCLSRTGCGLSIVHGLSSANSRSCTLNAGTAASPIPSRTPT